MKGKQPAQAVMIVANILGYPKDKAQELAALATFAWYILRAQDNVWHGHLKVKGTETDIAAEGYPVAVERADLALLDLMEQSLLKDEDSKTALAHIDMFKKTIQAELFYKEIDWDAPLGDYFKVARSYDAAFSYFARLMGEKTGFNKAASRTFAGLAHLNVAADFK